MVHRILCCSGSLEGGGSERQLWQLARHLNRPDFLPCVYLHYRSGPYLDQLPSDCDVHSFWDSPLAGRYRWANHIPGTIHRKQVQHLRSILKTGSVDLVYDRTFHMTLVTAKACQAAGVPRVSVIVSPPSKDFAGSNERFAASKKSLLAKAYAAPEACTLAVSEAVADDACEFYSLDRNKIKIARSPVDITEIQRLANAFQAFPNTQSNIVVVGRLSSEKGQGRAIEAFANQCTPNRSSRLHIVGDGPDRKKLQQLSDELQPTVQFHGHQANPYPFIAQADIVVIPSIYEGLPNIALEAMALGTPVIATKCSKSVEQLFAQRRGILVEPDSAEAIRSGLDQFFTLPQDKVQCIANRAKAYVAEHHAMDQWIDQMQAIFSEQIAAHRVKVRK